MKVSLELDVYGSWEWTIKDGGKHDVPDDVVARWRKTQEEWHKCEEEMQAYVDSRNEKVQARLKAWTQRRESIQHEKDRLEVERLRREWREKHEANPIVNRTAQTTIANEPIHVKCDTIRSLNANE